MPEILQEKAASIHNEGIRSIDLHDVDQLLDPKNVETQADWLIRNRGALPESPVLYPERRDNARTALMEALTASGHLSRVEISGTFDEINRQVLKRLLNGWDEDLPPHEKSRRFAEICEEIRIQYIQGKIIDGLLLPDTEVLTLSDYADFERSAFYGYRQKNKKGMARSTSLHNNEDGTYTRVIEQISRSNGTSSTSLPFLRESAIDITINKPADICVLSKQSLYSRSIVSEGVVAVQRALDTHAGKNVRYGDRLTEHPEHVDYENLREESLRREEQLEYHIDKLADFESKLDSALNEGLISTQEHRAQYADEVRQILRSICLLAPEYAEDCFGQVAASFYHTASQRVAANDIEGAMRIVESARNFEQTVIFCGISIPAELAKELGLEIDELGSVTSEAKEKWVWKEGVCRTDNCPTRPSTTKVGPCSVCHNCQNLHDKGHDPTKIYAGLKIASKHAVTTKQTEKHKRTTFGRHKALQK